MGKKIRKKKRIIQGAAVAGICAYMAAAVPLYAWAEKTDGNFLGSEAAATSSNAEISLFGLTAPIAVPLSAAGDFWIGWTGDLSFLSGKTGDGTEEKPYQISTKEQLMGLSELASRGMTIAEGEGTYPGDYTGAYFELTRNIDLGGMNWLPIGFFQNEADMAAGKASSFQGHFDGKGKTVSNFRIYEPSWNLAGLFGFLQDAEVRNLVVQPGNVITAKEYAGILAGRAENCVIRDVAVSGTIRSSGTAAGLAAEISDGTVVENCTADHVAIDAGSAKETFVGGITGKAAESLILDCVVNTGDTLSSRIQGGGYVGGIAGFQNGTDIFNVHVMGTIGGSGSQAIGGVTGKYASGKMKVARFEGKIASSGLGSASREGTFIGTHDTGFHFRYGTENGADLAYLFADSEAKIAAGVCGSGVSDDNRFFYDAHIGFWHGNDNFFTLVQGMNTKPEGERYFYEELEDGMLHVIDTEESVRNLTCAPDHFAPNSLGRPVRGYLVSVLQIDTAANVQNYYDVATLSARGGSAYSHDLDKSHRGAVAAGDTVTVVTAPKNTAEEKYQMDGVPTYTNAFGERVPMTYETGGTYRFVMPAHDTELSAVYMKVAASVKTEPEEAVFKVTQERTGDRKSPSTVTEVRDGAGKLIARYINGELEPDTEVQEVKVGAIVDENNDVADGSVCWSVDDDDLILLKKNPDEDKTGYTRQSASIELNLNADFFRNMIEKAEKEQAEKQYMYPISDTVYGNGNMGGVAVLTAKTRPSASFEGKPLTANCKILVSFQIKDRTKVAAEGASLDKTSLTFTVKRTLTGDRKQPQETVTVTPPQTLTAAFSPDYFDKKDIQWSVDDKNLISVEAGGYGSQNTDSDYKNARVSAVKDTKWIQDIMAVDDAAHEMDPYGKRSGTGSRTAVVTVTADDLVGNKQTASCDVKIQFVTEDLTEIIPEAIVLDKEKLEFDMTLTKTGSSSNPTLTWSGAEGQQVKAEVYPAVSGEREPKVVWTADPSLLQVDEDGTITPAVDGQWIQDAMKRYPYTAEKEAEVQASCGELTKTIQVQMKFTMKNQTRASSGSGSGSSSGGSGSSNRPRGSAAVSLETAQKGVDGVWTRDEAGHWLFTAEGQPCRSEWVYVNNPYAGEGQEKQSWFAFDENGYMRTGWYLDPSDGGWYYLHDKTDGSLGHMYTGWHQIAGKWYFFGPSGRMMTGWNWIDGRCYYMDLADGSMYASAVTPDGYTVDASGAWTVNGKIQALGVTDDSQ